MNDFIAELTKRRMYNEAIGVGRQLVEKSRSALGPENPDTLSNMFYLGAVLAVAGKLKDAEEIFRQLQPLRDKVLGQDDLDSIATLGAISEVLCKMRRFNESIKTLNEELRRCERAFGSAHERTIKTLRNMGVVYKMQNDVHLACSVLVRALELSERAFGLEHSTTSALRDELEELRGPPDSLILRQMLAVKHGIPIPGDVLANVQQMTTSQMLSQYKDIIGFSDGGPEVTNASALKMSEMITRPFGPPIIIPSAYGDDFETFEDEISESPSHVSCGSFGSLVERSITAWKRISSRRGKTEAIRTHSRALRSLDSLDAFLGFKDYQYWFFQLRKSFMQQKAFRKWDPNCLDEYILLPVQDGLANETDCIFISHYWHVPGNPDPQGVDLQPLQKRLGEGFWSQAAYFWVDFTCMPQWERTEPQQQYFSRALKSIPKLVRNCTFLWHFPDFQPRLWVCFEAAEFALTRSRPISLTDLAPFMRHLREMRGYGAKYVLNRHGYRCTNQSDRELVIGWLEMLLIFTRIIRSMRIRHAILDVVDNSMVGTCHHVESGITVNKGKGIITVNERIYNFTPVPFEASGPYAHVHIPTDSYYEKQLPEALRRAERAPDDRGYEEIAREFDREGEYKIAEPLHRKSLANAEHDGVASIMCSLSFLAENLENQARYEEAEELYRRNLKLGEKKYGPDDQITLESREHLAMIAQKRQQAEYYQRWKLESLETFLELERPNIRESGLSEAMAATSLNREATDIEDQDKYHEAKKTLWLLLEQRKATLGPYHPDTLETMRELAIVLRCAGDVLAATRLHWLALTIGDDQEGPEHVSNLRVMSNLAADLGLQQGKGAEVREIYRQQLERHLRAVDSDHPDTFTVKFNLAQELEEGEELQISKGRVKVLRRPKAAI